MRIHCWYQRVFWINVINLCRPVFTHLMSLTGLFYPNISFRCFRCPLIAQFLPRRKTSSFPWFFPFESMIFLLWITINRRMLFPRISFVKGLFRGLCVAFHWLAARTRWQPLWWGAKTENLLRLKSRGSFLGELPLFKWINRVCRFVRFSRNLARMFNGY